MPFQGAFQTTFLGWLIRTASGRRLLKYPDELALPERYTAAGIARRAARKRPSSPRADQRDLPEEQLGRVADAPAAEGAPPVRRVDSSATLTDDAARGEKAFGHKRVASDATFVGVDAEKEKLGRPAQPAQPAQAERGDEVQGIDASREPAASSDDAEAGDDPDLVTWYGPDDPENPQNWSTWYKVAVAATMALLTFSVYVGSSIYAEGISGTNSVMSNFDVSETTGLVGLTLFVVGYGIGPMLWSPMTEFPQIGRLPVYLGTLFVFVALNFPAIYARNIHTLLAMRFLTGFFGSPALAVGGSTMGDMFSLKHLAYALGVWGCGAVCGPIFGPLLGGFVFQANGWTWTLWVLVWLSGACLVFIACFFPETSAKNILHRRMLRLRRATGNQNLKTEADLESADRKPSTIIKNELLRPFIMMWDPTLLVFNSYLALIYGILYLWFECFPLVFQEVHGFNPGQSGLAFLGIFVGAWGACAAFCIYIHYKLEPVFDANGGVIPVPEIRLKPAPLAALCLPISIFGFGWSGQYESVHWIVPGFFGIGAFILFQTIFSYFGDCFVAQIGSVLTLNDLFRSSFGAAFPLFANALFSHLGIGGGCSLIGGLACCFVPFPFLFLKYGQRIRQRSKYATQQGIDIKDW